MVQVGPEALLVKSRVDPRAELAQYVHVKGSRGDVRATEAFLRRELAYLPVKRSAVQRLFGWGKKPARFDAAPLGAGPVVWPKGIESGSKSMADAREFAGTGLAALPAVRAGARPQGAPTPISALPALCPE